MKKQASTKSEYYNEHYSNKKIRSDPIPLLSNLSSFLSRFSLDINEAVYALLQPSEQLLEIGCGEGTFAFKASDKFQKISGFDISGVAIALANEAAVARPDKEKFHFSTVDLDEGIPFYNESFNTVVAIAVVEHLLHPPSSLKEISRILKPKGELVIVLPNDSWLPYRLQYLSGRIPASGGVDDLGYDWGHLHKFNVETIKRLLEREGYKTERVICSGVFANQRKHWLSLLAGDIIIKATKNG